MCVFRKNPLKKKHVALKREDALIGYRGFDQTWDGTLMSPMQKFYFDKLTASNERVPSLRKYKQEDDPYRVVGELKWIVKNHGFYAYTHKSHPHGKVICKVALYGTVLEFGRSPGRPGGFMAQKMEILEVIKVNDYSYFRGTHRNSKENVVRRLKQRYGKALKFA